METDLPLRDIHLPDPIGWWPPAPGWWLLLVGVPTLLVLVIGLWRFMRRMTVKKLALAELESIAQSDRVAREKLQQLAILLRRTALSVYSREAAASLVGEPWLSFLDQAVGNHEFSEGVGRLLIEATYRREVQADMDALFALCREWIKRVSKTRKAPKKTFQMNHGKSIPKPDGPRSISSPQNELSEASSLNLDPPPDYSRFAKPTVKEGSEL